jgi:hypothetical protein
VTFVAAFGAMPAMSQPPPLPPPTGLPTGIQILLGVFAVAGGLVALLVVAMILLTALRIDSVYVMIGILCVGSLAIGVPIAWFLQSNPAYRGWAIGIYVGLGLHLLAQAAFTMLVIMLAAHQH